MAFKIKSVTTTFFVAIAMRLVISGKGDVHCNDLPPGFDKMQMGINIASFDQFAGQPGFLILPVLDVTCNFNYTWKHPINGQVYDIPDQLTSNPIALPYDVTNYLSVMELTTKALEVNMAGSVSESYVFGMFSKTTSVSNSFKYLSEQSRFVGAVNSTSQAFKMDFWPPDIEPSLMKLSPQATTYLNSLPALFNAASVDQYNKFLENWGTHYNTEAFTGGYFRCEFYTSESFIGVMDKVQMQEQAGLYFMGFLQKSGAIAATIAPAAAAFKSATLFNCHCSPTCPDSQASFEQWQNEATYYPWLISVKYSPITDLISNKTLKANMIAATANYLAHSYLQYEVLPALQIFTSVIKNAVLLQGDPSCPVPAQSVAAPCSSGSCPEYEHGWYCRSRTGAPFTNDYNNCVKQQSIVNNTISSLINEANALLKEAIINITQLNQFGDQFVSVTNIMESGVSHKQCQYGEQQAVCVGSWCVCASCNCGHKAPGPLNDITYLTGLDHS